MLTNKSVGTGPSSYENRIYRAAVSQRLRNTALGRLTVFIGFVVWSSSTSGPGVFVGRLLWSVEMFFVMQLTTCNDI